MTPVSFSVRLVIDVPADGDRLILHALASPSRRRVTIGLLGLAATLVLPRGGRGQLAAISFPKEPVFRRFKAFWDNDPIGTHEFSVTPTGTLGDWDVAVDIDIVVDLGLFGDITYRHKSRETWRDGRIATLESSTDDDGDRYSVSGHAAGDYFRMKGPGGPFEAPGHLLTSNSAWSEAICQQREIIDATAGETIGMVASLDRTALMSTSTGQRPARVYEVISPIVAGSFWYNEAGVWAKGRIERSGEEIDYVPVS